MRSRFWFSLVTVLVCSTATAAPETYVIDSRHTFPSFEIRHLDLSFQRGRFNSTKGSIVLDLTARTVTVDISIDAASIDTGLEALEAHLRKSDFLDTEKYPTINFKSTGARFNGDTLTAVDGNISLRGQTRPVTLTVTSFRCGLHPMRKKPICGAEAVATIKRSDFGMTYGAAVVGDDVRLLLNVEAMQE